MAKANPQTLPRLFYNVRELAVMAGVSESTIRNEIKRGNLEVKQVGRKVLVPTQSADTWAKSL